MIHDDDNLHAWHKRLNLIGELIDKCTIIVNRDIGHDIDGEHLVFLRIIEAMHLYDVLVGGQCLHHF